VSRNCSAKTTGHNPTALPGYLAKQRRRSGGLPAAGKTVLYDVLPNVRSQKENVDSGIEEAGFAHPGRRRAIEFGLVAYDAAAEPSPA
jgi:hypothetical protein